MAGILVNLSLYKNEFLDVFVYLIITIRIYIYKRFTRKCQFIIFQTRIPTFLCILLQYNNNTTILLYVRSYFNYKKDELYIIICFLIILCVIIYWSNGLNNIHISNTDIVLFASNSSLCFTSSFVSSIND